MPGFASFFASSTQNRWVSANNKADDEPGKHHRVKLVSLINCCGKGNYTDYTTNTDRDKVKQIAEKVFANISQPLEQWLVNAKYNHHHTTRESRCNGTNTGYKAFQKANKPSDGGVFFRWLVIIFQTFRFLGHKSSSWFFIRLHSTTKCKSVFRYSNA